jgi:hypothetical protein
MRRGWLPGWSRLALAEILRFNGAVLGVAAALALAGCITNDPHPASPSTPGDPDHPPSASIHDRSSAPPFQSDVVNNPTNLDVNPYISNTEPSK